MNIPQKPEMKPSFNLLLGLTISLAVVLCALEHGYPLLGQVKYQGDPFDEEWTLEVELPPITTAKKLPDPPKQEPSQPKVMTASFTPEFKIVSSNEPDPSDLPEFDMGDINDIVSIETAMPPVISPVSFADRMPEFPGGDTALMKYLNDNLRYPAFAKDNNIQGDFYVRFVIDEKGRVQVDAYDVFRAVHPTLTKEALRVIKGMPDWTPGRQGPRNVPVYVNLPVSFKIK